MKHDSVLEVSLRWGEGDEEPVGRLASRDGKTYVEFDDAFLASGRVLSWFLRPRAQAFCKGRTRRSPASTACSTTACPMGGSGC